MGILKLGKDNWARTRATKEGLTFLALCFIVGFAALNTGNNLLYLAFGIMLSLVLASGMISMINLSRIETALLPQGDIYADTPSDIRISLRNGKSFITSYSLTIEFGGEKTYLPKLPSGSTLTVTLKHTFNKRGWNKVPEARLSTQFPFSFFRKWIKLDLGGGDMLVYPRVYEINDTDSSVYYKPGDNQADRTGNGCDMRSIRDYADGDNPKMIHWKTSARRGSLMVREMHDEESRGALIEFIPDKDSNALEQQISRVASIFIELLRSGHEVEFVSGGSRYSTTRSGSSPRPVLTYLALFDNAGGA